MRTYRLLIQPLSYVILLDSNFSITHCWQARFVNRMTQNSTTDLSSDMVPVIYCEHYMALFNILLSVDQSFNAS